MVSTICGTETVTRQQKNTSFGANEFRDGISYSEQQKTKQLVDTDDLANLSTGECYTLLPEPVVRVSKMCVPEMKTENINPGFIEQKDLGFFASQSPYTRNAVVEEVAEDIDNDVDRELENSEKPEQELLI